MSDRFADGRYRICDEPRRLPIAGAALPSMIVVLPITLYCALTYSPFFLLLPGALGVLIGGPHRWRDPLLSLLSLVTFFGINIAFYIVDDLYSLSDVAIAYALDAMLALSTLPLFFVIFGQQRTLMLRVAIER